MITLNTFDPNTHIQTITIVGLGGTGAQIARSVARMVYDMQAARLHTPQIILIDPDEVEHKNVGRQLYTEADVGQPKACVLMRRFNMALGLDIIAIDQPVNAERHFERWGNLIVGAVDNHLVASQSGCSSRSRGVWGYLKVAAHFVSKWLPQPHLNLKVIAPKDQGEFHVSLHV
jgi:hypothetical protein